MQRGVEWNNTGRMLLLLAAFLTGPFLLDRLPREHVPVAAVTAGTVALALGCCSYALKTRTPYAGGARAWVRFLAVVALAIAAWYAFDVLHDQLPREWRLTTSTGGLVIVLGIYLWLLHHRKRRERRNANGLCEQCGYDLRATPDKCPEMFSVL
jgi:4-amino-4-deoxy-L-arabinose transferase-like glycosyltransferase